MSTHTRETLRDRFYEQVGDPNQSNWTTTSANRFLYQSVEILKDYVDQVDEGYFVTTTTFTASPSTTYWTLPDDLNTIIKIRDENENPVFIIPESQRGERDNWADNSNFQIMFFQGNRLCLDRTVAESTTFYVSYNYNISDVSSDASTWDLPSAANDPIVLKAVIRAFKADRTNSNDTQLLEAEYQEAIIRLQAAIMNRQRNNSDYVREVW